MLTRRRLFGTGVAAVRERQAAVPPQSSEASLECVAAGQRQYRSMPSGAKRRTWSPIDPPAVDYRMCTHVTHEFHAFFCRSSRENARFAQPRRPHGERPHLPTRRG
jgi:hypothetical protein